MANTGLDTIQPQHGRTAEYLLLRTDRLMLVLPQKSIGKVRHLGAGEAAQAHATQSILQSGSIRDGKKVWFAALDDNLHLLPELPGNRFLLTTFTGYDDICWCWRDLYQIDSGSYRYFDLPAIVCNQNTPVHALAILDKQRRAFFTSAPDLVRFATQGAL